MTPELYQRLARSLELGKWPDGRPLSPAQREHTLQALIIWGERNLPEQERVGFVPKKAQKNPAAGSREPTTETLNWTNNDGR